MKFKIIRRTLVERIEPSPFSNPESVTYSKPYIVVGDTGVVINEFFHRYDAFDYIEHLRRFA